MGDEESQLYYTTSFEKKQAGNAGNARENTIFPADFLPGACRTGGENGGLEELLHVEDILSDDPQL